MINKVPMKYVAAIFRITYRWGRNFPGNLSETHYDNVIFRSHIRPQQIDETTKAFRILSCSKYQIFSYYHAWGVLEMVLCCDLCPFGTYLFVTMHYAFGSITLRQKQILHRNAAARHSYPTEYSDPLLPIPNVFPSGSPPRFICNLCTV
jgi:hypothetical protein